MKTIFILLFLVSCGKPSEECKSQEEMVLTCQAEEISKNPYPTSWEIEQAKKLCVRTYPERKCY